MTTSHSSAFVAALVCLLSVAVVVPWLAAGEIEMRGGAECERSCGGVDIPFPFGMGDPRCNLTAEFHISCYDTGNGVFKPFLSQIDDPSTRGGFAEVLDISLELRHVRLLMPIISSCYNHTSKKMEARMTGWFMDPGFTFNSTHNKFTVVGCQALAYIGGDTGTGTVTATYRTGCVAMCYGGNMSLSPCSGMGCCQTSIPKGMRHYQAWFDQRLNISGMTNTNFNSRLGYCSFAALMDTSNFTSSTSNNISSPDNSPREFNRSRGGMAPVIIDWSIVSQEDCKKAVENAGYACRSNNSFCSDAASGRGYICKCNQGFEGNPYLPDGCKDIDECQLDREKNPCYGVCTNKNGSFTCDCPPGTRGNASIAKCEKDPFPPGARVATGVSAGLLVALIAFLSTHVFLNKENKKRQRCFEQHGGRMLLRILQTDGNNTFKLYDRGDLVKATHGFHKANVVGEGAHGTVYKATLGTATVAVKRCKQIDKTRTDEFVQELVVLCRVNHPNIVRLLGCCLHFEAPMLVYEFVPNGTLGDLLYGTPRCRVTLPSRLRIAAETAEALAHLHAPPHPTLHGDIKPQNILLDKGWVAKVSDFGCSTINDNVQVVPKGTLAYLDPEFLQDFQITEKTDVYSFGVVLIELLTGKNPQVKEWKNLTVMFQDRMGNGTLGELLDPDIVEEASKGGLINAVAQLVSRCIAVPSNGRPDMGMVALELRRFSVEMPESPEAQMALEQVEVGSYSYTTSTEGQTTGSYSNLAALSTELAR